MKSSGGGVCFGDPGGLLVARYRRLDGLLRLS